MFCTISGKVPTSPVVNRNTGRLYERRLIEKALVETGGKCPETDDFITSEDLLPLRGANPSDKPNPVDAAKLTSVPAMLAHLQNEWDASHLEQQRLRRALREVRKELATALYRVDAAHRVISRLRADGAVPLPSAAEPSSTTDQAVNAEKTANSKRLETSSEFKESNGAEVYGSVEDKADVGDEKTKEGAVKEKVNGNSAARMVDMEQSGKGVKEKIADEVPSLWPGDVVAAAGKLEVELFTKRKARKVTEEWARPDDVASCSVAGSVRKGGSGAVVSVVDGGDTAYVAWAHGRIGSVDLKTMTVGGGVDNGHEESKGGATCVWWDESRDDRIISGGRDGFVRVWNMKEEWEKCGEYSDDGELGEVIGIEGHALKTMGLIGRNKGWEWCDFGTGGMVSRSKSESGGAIYTSCAVHPDGRLFGMGRADGVVEIVDASRMKVAERLGEGGGEVRALAMSEKGYQMGVCEGGVVRLWDLRKHGVVGQVPLDGQVRGVALDGMGEFGVAVSEGVCGVFHARKRTRLLGRVGLEGVEGGDGGGGDGDGSGSGDGSVVLGAAWGAHGKSIVVGGADGSVHKVVVG